MDSYKTAILRILVKRYKNPIEISDLVNGFPSHVKNEVSDSVLYLHALGYVSIYHSPTGNKYVSLKPQMKREALHLVNPEFSISDKNMDGEITDKTNTQMKQTIPGKGCVNRKSATQRSVIGVIILISVLSLWSLLNAYNHLGTADPVLNKVNKIQQQGSSMYINRLTPERNSDLILVSNYIIGPYNFALIQTEYPASSSTSSHDHIDYLNIIIEQTYSTVDKNSIIKVISQDSHKYRI
jgi:hypothetical protein